MTSNDGSVTLAVPTENGSRTNRLGLTTKRDVMTPTGIPLCSASSGLHSKDRLPKSRALPGTPEGCAQVEYQ